MIGPSPFGDYTAYEQFKRATKKQLKDNWSLKGWKKPKMRASTSTQGNKYQIPDNDYEDYMTFFRATTDSEQSEQYQNGGRLKDVQTPADYVDFAFGKNTKVQPISQAGVGHIKLLEYAPRHQVLKVTFWNDTVCAFFRVPNTIAATLIALAQTGSTRQDGRHLLGIYFWDLVRIRGTVHGTRYKFTYVVDHNTGGLPGRPYGSGEKFYDTEEGQNKFVTRQIELLKDALKMTEAKDVIAKQLASGKLDDKSKMVFEAMQELTAGDEQESIETIKQAIANLEAQPNVTRRLAKQVLPEGTELVDPTEAFLKGRIPEQLSKEEQRQLAQIQDALKHVISAPDAESAIKRHNAQRRIERNWDREKLDDTIEQIVKKNKDVFGKGGIEAFNNRFPNATQQFDYLKHRGFIPADARYIND